MTGSTVVAAVAWAAAHLQHNRQNHSHGGGMGGSVSMTQQAAPWSWQWHRRQRIHNTTGSTVVAAVAQVAACLQHDRQYHSHSGGTGGSATVTQQEATGCNNPSHHPYFFLTKSSYRLP